MSYITQQYINILWYHHPLRVARSDPHRMPPLPSRQMGGRPHPQHGKHNSHLPPLVGIFPGRWAGQMPPVWLITTSGHIGLRKIPRPSCWCWHCRVLPRPSSHSLCRPLATVCPHRRRQSPQQSPSPVQPRSRRWRPVVHMESWVDVHITVNCGAAVWTPRLTNMLLNAQTATTSSASYAMFVSVTRNLATGTKHWCQVLIPVFWCQNLVRMSWAYVIS